MARRLVKHIYVEDDTGELILDLGSKSEKGVVLLNGRLPTNFAPLLLKVASPLPTPGSDNEGEIITHGHTGTPEVPGEKTEVLICVRNSVGAYQWIEIGEST